MKKQREIIFLLTSILIIVVFWIGFNIYHNAHASTINDTLTQEITGISPDFNTKALERLKKRQYIDPLYTYPSSTNNSNIGASSSAKFTSIPVIQSTSTPTLNASNSGQL